MFIQKLLLIESYGVCFKERTEESPARTPDTIQTSESDRSEPSKTAEGDEEWDSSNDVLLHSARKKQKTTAPVYITDAISKLEKISSASKKETEFDLWARSLAVQLNSMDVSRALRLQLRLQTIVAEERIAHECRQNIPNASSLRESSSHATSSFQDSQIFAVQHCTGQPISVPVPSQEIIVEYVPEFPEPTEDS